MPYWIKDAWGVFHKALRCVVRPVNPSWKPQTDLTYELLPYFGLRYGARCLALHRVTPRVTSCVGTQGPYVRTRRTNIFVKDPLIFNLRRHCCPVGCPQCVIGVLNSKSPYIRIYPYIGTLLNSTQQRHQRLASGPNGRREV